jgi:hypothetical protein
MTLPLSLRPRARLRVALGVVAFGCVVLTSGAALAQVKTWHRVGTVTTQTPGQLCYTNGTDMVCDSNAPSLFGTNIGIGSTLPVVSLDDSQNPDAIALPGGSNAQRPTGAALVNGEIRYNNTGTGTVEAYYNGAWNSLVTSATAGTSTPAAGSTGDVQFNSGGSLGASSNFFWDNTNARLGIGTTSPGSTLAVNGSGSFTGGINNNSGGITGAGSIYGATQIQAASGALGALSYSFTGATNLGVYSPSANTYAIVTNGSERMRINGSGNVGIGTTSPTSLLHTYDGAAKTAAYTGVLHDVFDTSSTASVNKVGMDIESTGAWIGTSAVNTGLVVNATGGTTNYAATFNGGNVGIGTTSPGYPLHVYAGVGTPEVDIYANSGSLYGAILGINSTGSSGGKDWWIVSTSNTAGEGTGKLVFKDNTDAVEPLTMTSSGNVGIGTTAPGSSLQVNGGAAIGYSTNTAAPSNGALVNGQLGVGTTNPTSDVKADINGAAQIAGTGSEVCATMADVGKMRFNPSKNYFEICSP